MLGEQAAQVAVAWGPSTYDCAPPFSSGVAYPEYGRCFPVSTSPNHVYETVRQALRLLGLDDARYGSTDWNPLGKWVRPGDTVVLKPNLVRDFRESSDEDGECLITHGAVIRAILDYVYIAIGGQGRIVIADAPHSDADFDRVKRIAHLDDIREFYATNVRFPIEVYDLRPEAATKIDGVIVGHTPLAGDPAGYVAVNVGLHSAFEEISHLCHKLYGSEYDRREIVSHHRDHRHEYLISKTVLQADCVISIPKLKTHKKTGLTSNLKNLVGINGNKNWLPHHREGTPAAGGDQFSDDSLIRRAERATVALFKRSFPLLGPLRPVVAGPLKKAGRGVFGDTNKGTVRSGNWYGNDTTWRMVIDLNRILLYADADGRFHSHPIRRFFSLVDGIVAGEGNGPLDPTPRSAGLILVGCNPLAVDLSCARLMGFDYRRIPMLCRALQPHALPLARFGFDDVVIRSNEPRFHGALAHLEGPLLAFEPHFGWRGHIEVSEHTREARALA